MFIVEFFIGEKGFDDVLIILKKETRIRKGK